MGAVARVRLRAAGRRRRLDAPHLRRADPRPARGGDGLVPRRGRRVRATRAELTTIFILGHTQNASS